MNFIRTRTLFLLALALAPLLGNAQVQRLPLEIHSHTQGRHIIPLKQLIQQQHPHIQLRQASIVNVQVQAKSAQGQGQMALKIGQSTTWPQIVPGSPGQFHQLEPRTFHRLRFVPSHPADHSGVWQLEVQGQIKVARAVVSIQTLSRPTPPRPLNTHQIGQARFHKLIETQESFTINKTMVKSFEFKAERNMLEIIEVRALLHNGSELFLDDLTGFYSEGQARTTHFPALRGEAIKKLIVRAVSPNLFNARGELHVSLKSFD